jgi:hypothetical protein
MTNKTAYAPPAAGQLQYVHLEKLYDYLPGLTAALPAVFGVTPEEYAAIHGQFDAQARAAAEELLSDADVTSRVARLPFQSGARILAVGDSITDIDDLADTIRGFDELVVDLGEAFGLPARPDLQGPDGVHPSLAGQQRIVTALVETLEADVRVGGRRWRPR